MDFLVELGAAVITGLIWAMLLILILWLFKIHGPLQNRGKVFVVFIRGVVIWGWGTFLAMTALNYVAVQYFHGSSNRISPSSLVIGFVVFSVIGVLVGVTERWRHTSPDSTSSHPM